MWPKGDGPIPNANEGILEAPRRQPERNERRSTPLPAEKRRYAVLGAIGE